MIFKLSILCLSFFLFVKCETFRFANHYGDHMVLQREPYRAVLWGFGVKEAHVEISVVNKKTKNRQVFHSEVFTDSRGLDIWKITLPSYAHGGPYLITATSIQTNNISPVVIDDVLFGDVWVCGGQSNMVFTTGMAMEKEQEISLASHYPEVRLFTVSRTFSNVTVPELEEKNILQQWSVASKDSVGGAQWQYFSAVCWMYGRRLYDLYKIPIGLISSNYGGTRVEAWSSPETLAECDGAVNKFGPDSNSSLWNAMIYPLLNTTIYGVIWYQGEANTEYHTAIYNCTFPAMISGWRKEWYKSTQENTNPMFPFGFVQLAPATEKQIKYATIRWKQTAEYGYVPNPKQQNVFMAVAMDLPDNSSPYGCVHTRYKTQVAERLILGARKFAYHEDIYWTGPIFRSAKIKFMTEKVILLIVRYKKKSIPNGIQMRTTKGFQVNFNGSENWIDVIANPPIHDRLYLTFANNGTLTGLRYAWAAQPCQLEKCAVYAAGTNLPSPIFVTHGPFIDKDTIIQY